MWPKKSQTLRYFSFFFLLGGGGGGGGGWGRIIKFGGLDPGPFVEATYSSVNGF